MTRSIRYIHGHTGWPDLYWDAEVFSVLLGEVRYAQGRLLGRMDHIGLRLCGEADLVAMTNAVITSSAIEGETLDDRQVRSSLARKLGLETGGMVASNRQVDGVVEMMVDATRGYDKPLTQERLFGWHAALFPSGWSGLRRIPVGMWRTVDSGPMQVVSGRAGRTHVHFEAPNADRLEWEMRSFLEWFNASHDLDPVLKAAVAHFRFVTIHPFEDGNGRIARAIADMALARADRRAERFYCMSAQVERERESYYDVLEACQKGDLNITVWIEWFLACLKRALVQAESALAGILRKAEVWQRLGTGRINDRQRKILNRLMDGFEGGMTSSKYARMTGCSTDTALRDIQGLVALGVLVQNPGSGRSTSYRLCEHSGMGSSL